MSDKLHIVMKSIPHEKQAYPTVGNYWTDKKGTEQFRVSQMKDKRYMLLVLLHEFIEDYLCQHRGISEKEITEFDIQYEREREEGLHGQDDEPGHDPRAPYNAEHVFAERIERYMAQELGVQWDEYSKAVMEL